MSDCRRRCPRRSQPDITCHRARLLRVQIFNLDFDDDDGDVLLDWRPNRTRLLCCGSVVLPEWWYRLHSRQRKVPRYKAKDTSGII